MDAHNVFKYLDLEKENLYETSTRRYNYSLLTWVCGNMSMI